MPMDLHSAMYSEILTELSSTEVISRRQHARIRRLKTKAVWIR